MIIVRIMGLLGFRLLIQKLYTKKELSPPAAKRYRMLGSRCRMELEGGRAAEEPECTALLGKVRARLGTEWVPEMAAL